MGWSSLTEVTRKGGRQFTVRYRLLNGCHACELAGYARYAFKFDESGRFAGTEYLGLETSPDIAEKGEAVFSDPSTPIMVAKGNIFTLVLRSNPATGYIRQLAEPINDQVLQFISKEYRGNNTGRAGAGGSEMWTFRGVAVGETEIVMKYARPWEKETASKSEAIFKIISGTGD